ncbi:hypothetical protein ACCO45_007990 [Purpureocillium lilacinum]|uniref:Uncharacterized protein n=1 Tax=Purpureocillium lilacinum TaxID=33203 RepID=A0ACC4DM02_PURLI
MADLWGGLFIMQVLWLVTTTARPSCDDAKNCLNLELRTCGAPASSDWIGILAIVRDAWHQTGSTRTELVWSRSVFCRDSHASRRQEAAPVKRPGRDPRDRAVSRPSLRVQLMHLDEAQEASTGRQVASLQSSATLSHARLTRDGHPRSTPLHRRDSIRDGGTGRTAAAPQLAASKLGVLVPSTPNTEILPAMRSPCHGNGDPAAFRPPQAAPIGQSPELLRAAALLE